MSVYPCLSKLNIKRLLFFCLLRILRCAQFIFHYLLIKLNFPLRKSKFDVLCWLLNYIKIESDFQLFSCSVVLEHKREPRARHRQIINCEVCAKVCKRRKKLDEQIKEESKTVVFLKFSAANLTPRLSNRRKMKKLKQFLFPHKIR